MAAARATVYQAEHVQLQALASGLERRLRARLLGAAAAADRPAGSPGAVGTWEAPGDVRERLEAVTQLVEEWPIPTPARATRTTHRLYGHVCPAAWASFPVLVGGPVVTGLWFAGFPSVDSAGIQIILPTPDANILKQMSIQQSTTTARQ